MLIILTLYLVLVWLLFSRLKLLRWSWFSGTVAVLVGVFILAVFMAMFNYLTPSGKFVIISRVAEITPNVSGTVQTLPVKTNVPVKAGTILFQIDPAPFQYKVRQLSASLAGSKQQVLQLKASYDQATANVTALQAQLSFHQQRLKDTQKLLQEGAATPYREQDMQDQVNTTASQLQAALAAQLNAKLAMDFGDRRREHHRGANPGSARDRQMGVGADDNRSARRGLCEHDGARCRRPGAANPLGDVIHRS